MRVLVDEDGLVPALKEVPGLIVAFVPRQGPMGLNFVILLF